MRDFFIRGFERVVNILMVVLAVIIMLSGFFVLIFAPDAFLLRLLTALLIWGVGALYLILIGGALYISLGIYNNTLRTAQILERLEQKGRISCP